jgi:hypothetical protein
MAAEGLPSDAEQNIQEWGRSTSASRLTIRDNFPYGIAATQTKVKGQSP